MTKRLFILIMMTAFVLSFSTAVLADAGQAGGVSVFVDDNEIDFDRPLANSGGRILVPVRSIFEQIGYHVEWDSANQAVYINEPGIQVAKANAGAEARIDARAGIHTNDIGIFINNERIYLAEQEPINVDGRILIPVRYVTETLGYDVEWVAETQTVYISDAADECIPMEISFIDVGQGDAIFINYGEYEILIDAGVAAAGKTVVDYIRPYVDGPIELIIATHPDADHVGGLTDVIYAFDVDMILHNGETKDTAAFKNFLKAGSTKENCSFLVAEDTVIVIDDKVSLEIITPVKRYADANNNSIVAILTYGDVSIFLSGDMEAQSEKDLMNRFRKVDILKAAHHASRTSSSAVFMSIVDPDYVVISAGLGNTYKHPHTTALQRYFDAGAVVYGTFLDGTIVLVTDGATYSFDAGTPVTMDDAGDKAA